MWRTSSRSITVTIYIKVLTTSAVVLMVAVSSSLKQFTDAIDIFLKLKDCEKETLAVNRVEHVAVFI